MQIQNIFSAKSKIKFHDLYRVDGLLELDKLFNEFFICENSELYQQFQYIQNLPVKNQSDLLIEVAPILEDFLAKIFDIKAENKKLQNEHGDFAKLYQIKRNFIQRDVAKKYKLSDAENLDGWTLLEKIIGKAENARDAELKLGGLIEKYLKNENKFKNELKEISLYCAFALYHEKGIKFHQNGFLFKLPKKLDFANLIDLQTINENGVRIKKITDAKLHPRDGFKLTDKGFDLNQTLSEANYCIYCHNQGKDSCSIGLKEKDNSFKKDPFGTELSGCPLEEKISEMNLLKKDGFSIGALAMAIIDNPMIAGTGHRICNDCMKSCIYQKQEPVNIPQIESKVLKDVLTLPYGFEIYSLLTRWNPLNFNNRIAKTDSGYKVLVAGLGPAGFTLAHYLLNEGHLVVAIDGLKIEPLDLEISGVDHYGKRFEFKAIKDINEIYEELDERPVYGFGGVAEYGITARWDKNFLKIIRLLLERRQNFRMLGGVRLGSAMNCEDALTEYKFDHVALCLGAGWPNMIDMKNNFIKGIRSASDFLMALQLTGAEKKHLLTNLQIRLPAIVVGAGLTAIDTASEVLAYYVLQVEKFSERYEILNKIGVEGNWNVEEKIIAAEFLAHAAAIKKTRENGESILDLLKKWGGVKLVYRKKISDSPAYRLNHEELEKALAEGIEFIENAIPVEAIGDEFNHLKSVIISTDNGDVEMAAKSLFVAAGTSPNKAPFYEDKLKFSLDGKSFQILDLLGNKMKAIPSPKDITYPISSILASKFKALILFSNSIKVSFLIILFV
jgi:NADPH-dependent glutamate synthase beta subunit-like oxidoreductase